MSKIVFHRNYDGESIVDLNRDIFECFDPKFNDSMIGIPVDEHGFMKGKFRVNVFWAEDENEF